MSIMEAAGLSRAQAVEFARAYSGNPMHFGTQLGYARVRVANALSKELEASRPIEPGDVVRIPFAPTDEFEVRCVEDDEAWVLDVKSGGRLTVKLDCIERVQP